MVANVVRCVTASLRTRFTPARQCDPLLPPLPTRVVIFGHIDSVNPGHVGVDVGVLPFVLALPHDPLLLLAYEPIADFLPFRIDAELNIPGLL